MYDLTVNKTRLSTLFDLLIATAANYFPRYMELEKWGNNFCCRTDPIAMDLTTSNHLLSVQFSVKITTFQYAHKTFTKSL